MGRSIRAFSTTVLVLVLLLLVTEEMTGPKMAEARTCESQSHRFKGTCVRKSNCAHVCQTEGFHGGKCRGFRRRCFCTKPCHHHEEAAAGDQN
ncbi:Knottin [Macleaya cordata]|uniref:Knottin n=1 Tax=Macleaya cordata TaxID=56857 RepID=A0A200R044_MACCD|nr:Knottin [Macleaya cordata]